MFLGLDIILVMIVEGKETHLGKRAFVILCLEKSKIPGTLLLFTVIAYLLKDMVSVSVQPIVSSSFLYLTLATVIAFGVVFATEGFEYHNYTFVFEEFDIRMKRGIVSKKETSISYRQIQNVNIERNPTYQLLGLSKLILETAGREDKGEEGTSQVVIEAIDKKLAEGMRDMLLKKIGVQIVRPETPTT